MQCYEEYYREIRSADGTIVRIETHVPSDFNFAYDVIDRYAEQTPDKQAMVHKSLDGAITRFTFGDLKQLSDRAADMFERLGIGKGMPVMLLLKRRCEFWISVLALHKLGAVAVPTSHMVSAEDIEQRIQTAGVKAIICVNTDHICEKTSEAIGKRSITVITVGCEYPGFLFWDNLMNAAENELSVRKRVQTHVTDPMLYYFTSGTDGAPKAVIHDWSYPIAHIYTAKHWHGIQDGDLHLTVADSGWAKTAWGKLYGQWFLGASILVYDYDRFYAGEFLSLLSECKVNTFCAPPTIYKYLVLENLQKYDWSHLRCATTAGEPMPTCVAKQFAEATGVSVRDGFGQTETALQICTPVGEETVQGSIGKASPLYDIRIVDGRNKSVAPGTEGEIVIVPRDGQRPIGVFCGYLHDEKRYREVWRGGMYHTGDRAKMDTQGNVFFVGRNDDVIKSSGYRIGPSEVEDLLLQYPAVASCAVTGYPSRTRGMVVKASVVLQKGFSGNANLTVKLQEFVKKHGAVYKYPRIIDYVTSLPHTANGKINRAAIRERDAAALTAGR